MVGKVPLLAPELTTVRAPVPPVPPPEPLLVLVAAGAVLLALQAATIATAVAINGMTRNRIRRVRNEGRCWTIESSPALTGPDAFLPT